jgi:DNA-binding LacI/PurR family transcriptional regulator
MDDAATTQEEVLDSLASHEVDAVIVFPAGGTDESLREAADGGCPSWRSTTRSGIQV